MFFVEFSQTLSQKNRTPWWLFSNKIKIAHYEISSQIHTIFSLFFAYRQKFPNCNKHSSVNLEFLCVLEKSLFILIENRKNNESFLWSRTVLFIAKIPQWSRSPVRVQPKLLKKQYSTRTVVSLITFFSTDKTNKKIIKQRDIAF